MKLALFDVDGTLVNSRAMILAAMAEAFAGEGLKLPSERQLLSIVGLSLHQAMSKLVPDGEEARINRLAEAYKTAFWNFRARGEHTEDLFAGARDLLAELRGEPGMLLGIATGKSMRGIAHLLDTHGLQGWFATLQTADNHPSKPDPSMVLAALAETGVAAADTAMIGDTAYDIAMARAAGVHAVGVTWGNHPANELRHAGADVIVNDFKELRAALHRLWEEGDDGP